MTAFQPMITGTKHVVSSGHYLATQAAMDILDDGGNAVDAGVAANLVLGVVQSEMVQIAGVAPIMVYLADSNQVLTLTGVGPWPKATSLDRFVQEFGEVPIGILRTVVPAAPDANIQALGRWGTMRRDFSRLPSRQAPAVRRSRRSSWANCKRATSATRSSR